MMTASGGLLLKKVITQLVLPPGGLVLLAAVGLALLRRRRRWAVALVAGSLAGFWLLGTEPVKDALLAPLEDAYPPLDPARAPKRAAIVVLGGGIEEHAPAFGGMDRLSRPSLKRAVYAAWLARRIDGPIVPTGGAPLASHLRAEGEIMRDVLIELGVAPQRIVVEAEANDTIENARRVAAILPRLGVDAVVLVTTAWHMPRAMRAFRAAGLRPIPAPCDYRRDRGEPYDLRSFLPRWTMFADAVDALHEYLGLVWYRVRHGA